MRPRHGREQTPWWNDPKTERETKKQLKRNNLFAIIIMLIIVVFGMDIGGCTAKIGHFIGRF